MNSDLSASILIRPSVIKWVGKDFTGSLDFYGEKKDDYESSKVENIPPYTKTMQEHKQGNFSIESQATSHLEDINSKSLFSTSTVKNSQRKYECRICKRSFQWRSHWKSHERIHTGERPFKCKICGKAFTRSDGLQCHKKVHVNITNSYSTKPEGNPVLNKDFPHVVTVSKQERVFFCARCGRTFGSFAGYCRHTDRHKGKEDLKCHICNIIFNRPSALEIHSRIHTGLKPYQCNICSKAFSVRGNLKRHLFVHTGEKPYNCKYCSSCFNNSSHLTRHIRSKHKEFVIA